MRKFRYEMEVFIPDDSGTYRLTDDGEFFGPKTTYARRLFQCGPNEYTTHNLEPNKTTYKKIGMVYVPDAKNGSVTIIGNFPLYVTNWGIPVYILPEGCFTSVPYTQTFAELVQLHCRHRSKTSNEAAKIRARPDDKLPLMAFHCPVCTKRYETDNFMQVYCCMTCRNKRNELRKKEIQDFEDYGVASEAWESVNKNSRWKDVPYQKEICAEIESLKSSFVHEQLFPMTHRLSVRAVLNRLYKDGYLRIIRVDPKSGLQIYAHRDRDADLRDVEVVVNQISSGRYEVMVKSKLFIVERAIDGLWRASNHDGIHWGGPYRSREKAITWLKLYA